MLAGITLLTPLSGCRFWACEHEFERVATIPATCEERGYEYYECKYCSEEKGEPFGEPLGHDYEEKSLSASRLRRCKREGCNSGILPEKNTAFEEKVKYTFTPADQDRITALYNGLLADIQGVGEYDENSGYIEGSALEKQCAEMEKTFERFVEEMDFVVDQSVYAQVEYDLNKKSDVAAENSLFIDNYYTQLWSNYTTISVEIYNSAYREYYYSDMTEAEILEYLDDYLFTTDEEYIRLNTRNNQLALEFDGIAEQDTSSKVLDLYAELVENNNKIARLQGYDNYMQYAYTEIYGREYTYQDADFVFENVKRYVAPLWKEYLVEFQKLWNTETGDERAIDEYFSLSEASFFTDVFANESVNTFLSQLSLTDDAGKSKTYESLLAEAFAGGKYFLGESEGANEGAYVTYVQGLQSPLVYFGPESYQSATTVVHEFGHFVNELYNHEYEQSYDLLETHSQGAEVLYLSYLANYMRDEGYSLYKTEQIYYFLAIALNALAVNEFERAVYTNEYNGLHSRRYMADGKITKNEYDSLYVSILTELGISQLANERYWRWVTLPNPCYYISYSVSLLCSLQLYGQSATAFGDAVNSYLKLLTYPKEKGELTYKEALKYAGLYAYDDEQLYKNLQKTLSVF